jgi:hypothetical protein
MQRWKRYRCALALGIAIPLAHAQNSQIGQEVAIPQHLQNGQEFQTSLTTLLEFRQTIVRRELDNPGRARPAVGKRRGHANTTLRPLFAVGFPTQLQPLFSSRR